MRIKLEPGAHVPTRAFDTDAGLDLYAMHELHGFGRKRCSRVLNLVYDKLCFALTSQDAIQEVYDAMGLEIHFSDDVTEDAVTEKGA